MEIARDKGLVPNQKQKGQIVNTTMSWQKSMHI